MGLTPPKIKRRKSKQLSKLGVSKRQQEIEKLLLKKRQTYTLIHNTRWSPDPRYVLSFCLLAVLLLVFCSEDDMTKCIASGYFIFLLGAFCPSIYLPIYAPTHTVCCCCCCCCGAHHSLSRSIHPIWYISGHSVSRSIHSLSYTYIHTCFC